jgi:hypothetical protein
MLGRLRERVAAEEKRRGAEDRGVVLARRLCLAAEGSDWFWWYGEPFSSAEDPVFDELFRAHLEAGWRALGEEPPAEVAEPLVAGGVAPPRASPPPGRIHPQLDGKAERFFEWQGAAVFDVGRGGAMADSGHPIERVHVGFDDATLFLRIDPQKRDLDPQKRDRRRLAACKLTLRLRAGGREETVRILTGAADGGAELVARGGKIGALNVVELSLPLSTVGAGPRDELRMWMSFETAGMTFARVPRDGSINVLVPWEGWEEENWTA